MRELHSWLWDPAVTALCRSTNLAGGGAENITKKTGARGGGGDTKNKTVFYIQNKYNKTDCKGDVLAQDIYQENFIIGRMKESHKLDVAVRNPSADNPPNNDGRARGSSSSSPNNDDDTNTIADDKNISNTTTINDADDNDAIEQEWARIHSKVHAELKTKNGSSAWVSTNNKSCKRSETKGDYIDNSGNFSSLKYLALSFRAQYFYLFFQRIQCRLKKGVFRAPYSLPILVH